MPTLTMPQIEAVWTQAGGDVLRGPIAVAVAMAESGGNTTAASSTDDYGLWQINAIHFPGGGPYLVNWADPAVNAGYAIRISANGTDWGAWCTCYADPRRCGSIHPLVAPQPGSPAAGWVGPVLSAIGRVGPTLPPPTSGGASIDDVWGTFQRLFHDILPSNWSAINEAFNQVQQIGR